MPTSKEARQTRTASGEKNPSLHAVYQQRSQTNKNCKRRRESKPACSLIERGLEVSKARRSYMPTSNEAKQTRTASGEENPSLHAVSSSAVWRSPNSSSLLKAPCPVQEHQCLQHEVAERDLTPEPRSVWKPRGQKPSRGTRLSAYETTVLENTSLVQALRRLRLYSAF